MNNKVLAIIRWIAVLPGGYFFGILSLFFLRAVLYFTLVKGSIVQMPLDDIAPIELFLSPIIMSAVFVYAGAMIAPKKRFLVSIVLFVYSILFHLGILFFLQFFGFELDMSMYGLSKFFLSGLAGAVGIYLVYEQTEGGCSGERPT